MVRHVALVLGIVALASWSARAAQEDTTPGDATRPRCLPMMRGTLWWLRPEIAAWSDERLESAVQAQRDVGFDLLWLLNAAAFPAEQGRPDVLERIYALAAAKEMKVIIDLPQGGWYGRTPAEEVIATATEAVRDLHRRLSHHASFHGWYLNYEINPIRPDDTEETAYWRRVWKSITAECHRVAPDSVVTISPFFLLDETSRRGFIYLTPEQYADWWGATLKESAIDVIMLQDSGEHLAFFTLAQREPFWVATAKAAREAGAQFWLNVETGEADVGSWEEYLPLEAQRKVPWRFTPIEWLERKLRLAAEHADHIVNWGYFPFMDPHRVEAASTGDGASGATPEMSRAAYEAYKAYYRRILEDAAAEEVRRHVSDMQRIHDEIGAELTRVMPVRMRVAPGLVNLGDEVHVQLEVMAGHEPHGTLEVYANQFVCGLKDERRVTLAWRAEGACHGLTRYRAEHRFVPDTAGNWLLRWVGDVGGDIDVFWRHVAVLDHGYAVCLFESTSHREPRPESDFHELRLPFDYWDHRCLWLANFVDHPDPQAWATASRVARQHGLAPTPMLFTDYFLRQFPKESRFAEASPKYQRTVLSGLCTAWPLMGHDGEMTCFAAYSLGGGLVESARASGFRTIAALCPEQNWQDGSFRINQSGMPSRPYFISREDFRKPGDGGPDGLVGISQCTRNPALNRDFNVTYVLEPAWNEFGNRAGGRREVDDIHMSRMYDFFDGMVQNRMHNTKPFVFSVGVEFNGVDPVIRDSNRLMMEYAVRKAAAVPIVFATAADVTDYYRRTYTETPETASYQPDFFGGITVNNKPATYSDQMELENERFRAVIVEDELLPYLLYDYTRMWKYPDWGNEDLPRNERGYLEPGTYDRFAVTPAIVDTRQFEVAREEAWSEDALRLTVRVQAGNPHGGLPIGLWHLPCRWQANDGWWSVSEGARFVPIRAPFTGSLHGILVAEVREGANTFELVLRTSRCEPRRTSLSVNGIVDGQIFERDGNATAYLWPSQPGGATVRIALPDGLEADAYVAPEGERQPLSPAETRVDLAPGGWMRMVGLDREQLLAAIQAERPTD